MQRIALSIIFRLEIVDAAPSLCALLLRMDSSPLETSPSTTCFTSAYFFSRLVVLSRSSHCDNPAITQNI